MDLDAMVNPDLDAGVDLLAALKERGLEVEVAAWLRDPEHDRWRFVIATETAATAGRRTIYRTIEAALAENADLRERLPQVHVVDSSDPGVEDLRRLSVARPGSMGATFPATTIAGEPFYHGWVYNVPNVTYGREVLRALQRVGEKMDMVIRRGEDIFGSEARIDFVIDRVGTPIAVEAKVNLSESVADQLSVLRLRIPESIKMLVVSPESEMPTLTKRLPATGLYFVRWRAPEDDVQLRQALTDLFAA